MPKKPAVPSKHTQRNDEVRERLHAIKSRIQVAKEDISLTHVIAAGCDKIAKERSMTWYKNWKDQARSVRMFMEGLQDMSWDRLAVIDLFCADVEAKYRIAKASGVPFTGENMTVTGQHPEEVAPDTAGPVTRALRLVEASEPAPLDPEIAALYAIKDALDTLEDTAARRRVIAWASDKFLA